MMINSIKMLIKEEVNKNQKKKIRHKLAKIYALASDILEPRGEYEKIKE